MNHHIKKYLDYYLGLNEPGYSVLINAKWGAGKTFFIKGYLKELHHGNKNKFAYVSLSGLSNINEVYEALIAVFMPVASKKGVKVTGSLLGSLLKYNSIGVNLSLDDFVSPIRKNKFYVFDDLERYQGNIKEVFGFISALLEQDGVKVIILANEEKLREVDRNYLDNKEKVIGKTLSFETNFKEASESFLKEVNHKEGVILLNEKIEILQNVFLSSGFCNLRILRQAIYEVVDVLIFFKYMKDDENVAFENFLSMYFCLFFEYHSGSLSADDVLNRQDYMMYDFLVKSGNYKKSNFDSIVEKYKGIDLRSNFLSNDAWHYFIVNGFADSGRSHSYLLESPYFSAKSGEQEWSVIWHWYDRDEEVFYQAIKQLEEKFNNRYYKEPSEILHVFSSKIWLARKSFVDQSYSDAVSACYDYVEDFFNVADLDIDNYFNNNKIGVYYSLSSLLDFSQSAYGLAYLEQNNQDFNDLSVVLLKKIKEELNSFLFSRGEELLNCLEVDARRFYSLVCDNDISRNPYVEIPILSYVPESEFANILVELGPEERRLAFIALSTRLFEVQGGMKLRELEWLISVRDYLNCLATGLSDFKHKVIKTKIKNHIDRVLITECNFAAALRK